MRNITLKKVEIECMCSRPLMIMSSRFHEEVLEWNISFPPYSPRKEKELIVKQF